jgi:hypothetical protein
MRCNDQSDLHQVNLDVTELVDYVGSFVDWWGQMKAKLLSLWETIPMIRLDGSNPFRTATVQNRWTNVKGLYTLYRIQVSYLSYVMGIVIIFLDPHSRHTLSGFVSDGQSRKPSSIRRKEDK